MVEDDGEGDEDDDDGDGEDDGEDDEDDGEDDEDGDEDDDNENVWKRHHLRAFDSMMIIFLMTTVMKSES